MNEKLLEFFKSPSAYIKRLLQQALDEKWYEGSQATLFDTCPFCEDVTCRNYYSVNSFSSCRACFCPPEICHGGGFEGMVGELESRHATLKNRSVRLSVLTESELHGMLSLFKARLDNLDCRD
jgi:hypothetical protein